MRSQGRTQGRQLFVGIQRRKPLSASCVAAAVVSFCDDDTKWGRIEVSWWVRVPCRYIIWCECLFGRPCRGTFSLCAVRLSHYFRLFVTTTYSLMIHNPQRGTLIKSGMMFRVGGIQALFSVPEKIGPTNMPGRHAYGGGIS
jgi:hypothetical protein